MEVNRRIRSKTVQNFLGFIFLSLGAWALLFPGVVETFVLSRENQIGTTASAVLIGCFGAQAMLCALLIFLTQFTFLMNLFKLFCKFLSAFLKVFALGII